MKTRQILLVAALATLLLSGAALAVAATAGGYSLNWFTVASGGGTSRSSGGRYTLSGTAGQSDAGTLTGSGGLTLQGGFWGGVAATSQLYLPLVRR